MKIYLVRHGESKANELNVFLGHGDLDLTEKGRLQAEKTANFLKDVKANAIYSSDLSRAYNTALATAEKLNLPIIKDKGLREIDAGEWDFMPYVELAKRDKEGITTWITNFSEAKCFGGESVKEVQKRMVSTIDKIVKENLGKTLLLFSHATSIRAFVAFCIDEKDMQKIPWVNNASVTVLEYNDGKYTLLEYGKDDFMDGISTSLPQGI